MIKSLALAKALNGKRYSICTPVIINRIVNVAAGSEHTVAVTDKGEVYTWGGNIDGQLGIKTEGARKFFFN